MKYLLLLLIAPLFGTSQERISILKDTVIKMRSENNLIHIKQGTPALVLSNGAILARHSMLTLGKGSLPNGDFNYIATPSNSMEAKLKARTTLKQIEITEIKIKGNKKYGYKYIIVCQGNYLIQLEDAIAVGEIESPVK